MGLVGKLRFLCVVSVAWAKAAFSALGFEVLECFVELEHSAVLAASAVQD
jgi:hypothetical protein